MNTLNEEQIKRYADKSSIAKNWWIINDVNFKRLLQAQAELTKDEIIATHNWDKDHLEYFMEGGTESGTIEYPYLVDDIDSEIDYTYHLNMWHKYPGIECVCEFKPKDDGIEKQFIFQGVNGEQQRLTLQKIDKNKYRVSADGFSVTEHIEYSKAKSQFFNLVPCFKNKGYKQIG